MQTTRQRILEYLEKNQRASAPELSLVLDQTQANIRHHLEILEKTGKIEVVGETKAGGRGRPTLIYMTARTAQTNALDVLSSLLLQHSLEDAAPRKQQIFLAGLARRLVGSAPQTGSITIRLSGATQYLNEYNYKAHWEAHADAPNIFFDQCPFAQIIRHHPELCQMDKYILQYLTGEKVDQIEKQSRSPDGPNHCRFVVRS